MLLIQHISLFMDSKCTAVGPYTESISNFYTLEDAHGRSQVYYSVAPFKNYMYDFELEMTKRNERKQSIYHSLERRVFGSIDIPHLIGRINNCTIYHHTRTSI